jgi:hypothetical protein
VDLRSARASTGRLGAALIRGLGLRVGVERVERWVCHWIVVRGGSATFSALYRWRIHRRQGQTWQKFSLLVDRATRRKKHYPPRPQGHPRFFLHAFEVQRFCVGDGIP